MCCCVVAIGCGDAGEDGSCTEYGCGGIQAIPVSGGSGSGLGKPSPDVAGADGALAGEDALADVGLDADVTVSPTDIPVGDVVAPDAQPDAWPPEVYDTGVPDGAVLDVFDAGKPDGGLVDAYDAGKPDGGLIDTYDAGKPDGGLIDAYDAGKPDAWLPEVVDAGKPDAWLPEVVDAGKPDGGLIDAYDAGKPDGGLMDVSDAGKPDGGIFDAADAGPDLVFPPDADIYGGTKASCLEIFWCVAENADACASGQCLEPCKSDASLWARSLFDGQGSATSLEACLASKCLPACGASTAPSECMNDCLGTSCLAPALTCASNGNSGTTSCPEALKCALACKPGKAFCIFSCYGKADPDAQGHIGDLFGCMGEQPSCMQPAAACLGGPGTLTCAQVLGCGQSCAPGDAYCWYGCYAQGTASAEAALDAFTACQAKECAYCSSETCRSQCTQQKCSAYYLKCLTN